MIGPVELVVNGQTVGLRSSRARRLVAMLALYRDRVVSGDRLVDAVWGETLPAEPAAALQNQLSRLRSVLGADAAGIETTSGGYRLRSDVIRVDVDVFEALLASAREPERAAAERAQLLDQAVALVRGAAFEDLEVEDAYIEARRIQELAAAARLAATAAHVDANAAGRRPARRVPAPLVQLVGRAEDLDAVASLLATGRLVTLTGPGGVGKTTLAFAAVQRHCAEHDVPNAFVDLATVSTADDVAEAFARALGVERPGDQPWVERLTEAVGGQHLVLLVDNAEHVADAVATILAGLVARADVVVLTTSRVPLDVPGEHLWIVEPLALEGSAPDLFYQRARAVRPSWATAREDDASIREICRRVDGLPLAIELAAAQLRWRTAAEVAASLERPLDALDPVSAGRGRQPDLRSVIDRSYRLLDAQEQRVLDHLGVFAGGFTAATAEAVCDDGGVIRIIGSLVQHSLVRPAPVGTETRYTLLDTIRHFALERLEVRGETTGARDRHAAAMLALVEVADRQMWGPDEPSWVQRLDDERADICAAHQYLLARGNTELALRLATAAYWVSWPRGWSDLRGLIRAALGEDAHGKPDLIAPSLGARADFALHAGDTEAAVRLAERALVAAEGRPDLTCFGQSVLADVALFGGRTHEAVAGWRAARDGFRATHPALGPWATAAMALALTYGGRREEAVAVAAEAVEAADMSGSATARAFARYAAGEADPAGAQPLLSEAIAIAETASVSLVANLARLSLATSMSRRADPAGALTQYPVLLQGWRRSGHWAQQWISLRTLVPILVQAGKGEAAATILGGLRRHGQADAWGADADDLRAAEAVLRTGLGEFYEAAVSRGSVLTPVELVLFAEGAAAP